MRTVPRLCEFYPGICLTTEEKTRKNLSQGKKNPSEVKKKSEYSIHLPKHPHKHTHYTYRTDNCLRSVEYVKWSSLELVDF
jgi:hypothetical protein